MHEYYLTRQDGTVVFSHADQPGRLAFLEEEFEKDNPTVNDDISFDVPDQLKTDYDSLFLRVLPSYSGCRVAVKVIAHTLADHSVVYEPFVPLPDDLNIYILINRKNFRIDAFSNSRINRPCSPIYFFSNLAVTTPRALPFLTTQIAAPDSSFEYEQGELSLSAAGKVQEYYRKGTVDRWDDVIGEGFASERDRTILPESFVYTFNDTSNLTEVKFTLTDAAGSEASSTTITNSSGIDSKNPLDFTGKVTLLPLTGAYSVNEYLYTLLVSGNNGYNASHTIIFNNSLSTSDPWAVINIRCDKGSDPYNIFSNDNYLKKRRDGSGVWTEAPVFEIPVKSRLAYWRYISNKDKELNVSAGLVGFVNKVGNVIETLKPRALAMHSFLITKDVPMSTDTAYVPNPEFPGLQMEKDKRIFLNIRVPNSELFPEVP